MKVSGEELQLSQPSVLARLSHPGHTVPWSGLLLSETYTGSSRLTEELLINFIK